ncbi:hypothetical protein E2C01_038398 [Portunus trituberculatus]|uniref:Uncharacterized protein n=1 Tax=Portunus trituberculatus TaxID=210409 RepID=A0A5B7FIF5_PORTR|nr:hypothetical protein [Portunus trituberculatus]
MALKLCHLSSGLKLPTCHHDTQVLHRYTKDALGW